MGKGTGRGRAAALVPPVVEQRILDRVHHIRGTAVMLDEDLAVLYGVSTGRLNEAVGRSLSRFPDDFMFRLTAAEATNLKSQSAISSGGHGGRRSTPRAFTELGVAMLSSVLSSRRAIAVNILIMRAFVQLRRAQGHYTELRTLIEGLAQKVAGHEDLLTQILEVLAALERTPPRTAHPIGFRPAPPASAIRARRSR